MDLPPDKAKLLKNYDSEKKWDIICDQVSPSLINFFPVLDLYNLAREISTEKSYQVVHL